jgi:exosortase/archaeosortase family protein
MKTRNKKVVAEALKFIAGFLLFLAVAYCLIFLTPLNYALKATAAYSTQALLSVAGVQTAVSFPDNPHLMGANFDAEFVDLCGGGLELAVLVAVILATCDRSWRQRFLGALLGILVLLVLNALRISLTLLLFDAQQEALSELFHGVLFRLSLIAIIVGYYYIWYVKLSPHWKK